MTDRMSEMIRKMSKVKMIEYPEYGTDHEVLEQRIYDDGSKTLQSCMKKGRKIFYVNMTIYMDKYGRPCPCHQKPDQKRKYYREFTTLSAATGYYNRSDPFSLRLQKEESVRVTLD